VPGDSQSVDFQKTKVIERKMAGRMIPATLQRSFGAPCSAVRAAASDHPGRIEFTGRHRLPACSVQSWRQARM
jgi:hypothetical protein